MAEQSNKIVMGKTVFSIIIPVYNVELYLHDCLDSVLNQGFELCELICVNDGSTDGSAVILEEYALRYPQQLKVVSQSNAGLSAARNAGLALADGEYILFLDSDDMLAPASLDKLAALVAKEQPEVVAFSSEFFFQEEQRREANVSFNHPSVQIFPTGMEYFDAFVALRNWGPSAVCFYAFNRQLLAENHLNFETGLLHEDELFMPQVLCHARKIFATNEILYTYRIRRMSITGAQTDKNYEDKLRIALMLSDFFTDKKIVDKFVNRNIYNMLLAGIQGLMDTPAGRIKIELHSRKLMLKVAATLKELFVAGLIRVDVRLYSLYYKIFKSK